MRVQLYEVGPTTSVNNLASYTQEKIATMAANGAQGGELFVTARQFSRDQVAELARTDNRFVVDALANQKVSAVHVEASDGMVTLVMQ